MASTGSTSGRPNGPFVPSKIPRYRAGSIATAYVQVKFSRHGFYDPDQMGPRSPTRDEWIKKRAQDTGISVADLTKYVPQVIQPALRGAARIVNPPSLLTVDAADDISLRLFYLECTNIARIDDQVDAFVRHLPSLAERGLAHEFRYEEVASLVIHYAIPYYINRLTGWDPARVEILFRD